MHHNHFLINHLNSILETFVYKYSKILNNIIIVLILYNQFTLIGIH